MNHLELFRNSEFGELNILLIDGKEYFPATACAKILGYKRPTNAVATHCKEALKQGVLTKGGWQEQKFISEGDLYRLIINSKLPTAERFERWVMDEVLPELRKKGSYGMELQQIIAVTVRETIKEILPLLEDKETRQKNRANGKVDRLPPQIKNRIIKMLYEENNTYEEISIYLDSKGYNIHLSSIYRFKKKIDDMTNEFLE